MAKNNEDLVSTIMKGIADRESEPPIRIQQQRACEQSLSNAKDVISRAVKSNFRDRTAK